MKKIIILVLVLLVVCSTYFVASSLFVLSTNTNYILHSNANGKKFSLTEKNQYAFSIKDLKEHTVKDFLITHTKPMHVIVVRKDLAYFQHIHPDFDKNTGFFNFDNIVFPEDGPYRIFTDFMVNESHNGGAANPKSMTLFEDVIVGNKEKYILKPLVNSGTKKSFDGYDVSLSWHGALKSGYENMLMFSLSFAGKPVIDLEPYLGAMGHTVILREETLDFIHAHPLENNGVQNGMINFMVTFPKPGNYKIFTQFQRDGKVTTTDFVVSVEQGYTSSGSVMPSDSHSMVH